MNVSQKALAVFTALNHRGAGLGTWALPTIEKALEEVEAAQPSEQRTCLNCGNTEDNHVGRGHHFAPKL